MRRKDDLDAQLNELYERGQSYNVRLLDTNRKRIHPPYEVYGPTMANFDATLGLDARLELGRLRKRIRKLAAALLPYAAAAEEVDDEVPDDAHLWENPVSMNLTAGHLRAAFFAVKDAVVETFSGDPRSSPDDLRKAGWSVAVHNDYRLDGVAHTFWLFTRDGVAVKGEGETDADALDAVRAVALPAPRPVTRP